MISLIQHFEAYFPEVLETFTHAFLNFGIYRLFLQINFLETFLRNSIRMSNSLDPDQARCFVGPDLGPNCLQRLSAPPVENSYVMFNSLHAG